MSMPLPPSWTLPEGYTFTNLGRCRAENGRAEVAWCITPAGRHAPINRDGTSHFSSCVDALSFRKRSRPPASA